MTTPVQLAIAHQDSIRGYRDKIQADAGCINRLLVGRTVRRRGESTEFTVTEARLGLSAAVTVHGKPAGKKRTALIGTVRDIELVEPKP
jgi:hypothetical protein